MPDLLEQWIESWQRQLKLRQLDAVVYLQPAENDGTDDVLVFKTADGTGVYPVEVQLLGANHYTSWVYQYDEAGEITGAHPGLSYTFGDKNIFNDVFNKLRANPPRPVQEPEASSAPGMRQ